MIVAHSGGKAELFYAAKHVRRNVRATGPVAHELRELLLTTVGRDESRLYDHTRHIFPPRQRCLQGAIHRNERCRCRNYTRRRKRPRNSAEPRAKLSDEGRTMLTGVELAQWRTASSYRSRACDASRLPARVAEVRRRRRSLGGRGRIPGGDRVRPGGRFFPCGRAARPDGSSWSFNAIFGTSRRLIVNPTPGSG